MMTTDDLLHELEQETATTRRVLSRVPAEHLGWRPHERSFTLGQLAMHVAMIPGAIAQLSLQPTFDATTPLPRPGASSTDELLTVLDESVARARSVLRAMDDAELDAPWRAMAGDVEVLRMTRAQLLRSVMLNHWYHHRGQLTVYLRQVGARVPSVYGPSADEAPGSA